MRQHHMMWLRAVSSLSYDAEVIRWSTVLAAWGSVALGGLLGIVLVLALRRPEPVVVVREVVAAPTEVRETLVPTLAATTKPESPTTEPTELPATPIPPRQQVAPVPTVAPPAPTTTEAPTATATLPPTATRPSAPPMFVNGQQVGTCINYGAFLACSAPAPIGQFCYGDISTSYACEFAGQALACSPGAGGIYCLPRR